MQKSRSRKTHEYQNPKYINPIYVAWRHFGCNLSHDTLNSIYKSVWLTWQLDRAMKKFRKTLSPRQLKYLDSIQ